MPIKIPNDLPAVQVLADENIFVMTETRAITQDIRPLKIAILTLMPLKEDTELQILRALSNTPLQIDVTFVMASGHVSLNTSANHLNKFYNIKRRRGGMIVCKVGVLMGIFHLNFRYL